METMDIELTDARTRSFSERIGVLRWVSSITSNAEMSSWILISIVLPLLPFVIGGLVRVIITGTLLMSNFSASDWSISLTLFSMSIIKDLLITDIPLNSKDEQNEIIMELYIYGIFTLVFICLYSAIIVQSCNIVHYNLTELEASLKVMEITSFIFGIYIIRRSLFTKESFRLKVIKFG